MYSDQMKTPAEVAMDNDLYSQPMQGPLPPLPGYPLAESMDQPPIILYNRAHAEGLIAMEARSGGAFTTNPNWAGTGDMVTGVRTQLRRKGIQAADMIAGSMM